MERSVNDYAFAFLRSEGYQGSLGEMMYAYFLDGEGTIEEMLGGAALAYWRDLYDSIEE